MKKTIALFFLIAVAIVTAAIFWMRGNLDGLVRTAIINYGSAMLQSTVKLDKVEMTPVDGRGVISGLVINNPTGFKTAQLLSVSRIEIEIDMATIAKDVIVIRRIAVAAPNVTYEKSDLTTNVDAIQKNIAGYLGPANTAKPGKKMIIEEFTIRNAKAEATAAFMNGKTVQVALPDITLKDLGKAKGGMTGGEVGQAIAAAMKSRITGAFSFDRALKQTGEALDKAGGSLKGLFK